jgi:hypothetical protein
MWALFATEVEREFHFAERSFQVGGRNRVNQGLALVADYVGLVSPDDAIQTTTTLWIAKTGMWHRGQSGVFHSHKGLLEIGRSSGVNYVVAFSTNDEGLISAGNAAQKTWA